jgi:hypothetical protein
MRMMNYGQEFLHIRESHQQLRRFVVLNVHRTTEDETVDTEGSFSEQSKHVIDKFLKYHTKIYLKAKRGRYDIFKHTTGKEILREYSIHNGLEVVNFETPEIC